MRLLYLIYLLAVRQQSAPRGLGIDSGDVHGGCAVIDDIHGLAKAQHCLPHNPWQIEALQDQNINQHKQTVNYVSSQQT